MCKAAICTNVFTVLVKEIRETCDLDTPVYSTEYQSIIKQKKELQILDEL